jgi:hypothetical protein
MIVDGILYPLRRSARITSANGGFYWRTPLATDGEKSGQNNLPYQAKLFPTPTARDFGTSGNGVRKGKQRQIISLGTMARKDLWPTPQAMDWKDYSEKQGKRKSANLSSMIHFRTPNASDWKNRSNDPEKRKAEGKQVNLSAQVGGSLNPQFVEWLMGYPLEWTALSVWETQSYRFRRRQLLKD